MIFHYTNGYFEKKVVLKWLKFIFRYWIKKNQNHFLHIYIFYKTFF